MRINTWLKAKIALLVITSIWASLIITMLPLMMMARAYDNAYNLPLKKRWLYSILIAQDILVNCILGGYFRTTISSELGNLQRLDSRTGTECAEFVNWLFRVSVGQENHCIASIEPEDIHLFDVRKAITGAALYLGAITIGVL